MPTRAKVKLRVREAPSFKRLLTATKDGKKLSVKVGFVGENATKEHEGGGITNARLAAVLEYGYDEGTPKIPARPALGPCWDSKQQTYRDLARRMAERVAQGKMDLETGLGIIGAQMAADLKAFITAGDPIAPVNAESVRKRKERKSSGSPWGVRTWVDTGALVNSITWVVVSGDGT